MHGVREFSIQIEKQGENPMTFHRNCKTYTQLYQSKPHYGVVKQYTTVSLRPQMSLRKLEQESILHGIAKTYQTKP